MRTIACTLLFVILLLDSGCQKRSLPYTANVKLANAFTIDQVGTFSTQNTITPFSVGAALNLPGGARVKTVHIESLDIEAQLQPNDVATAMTVTGKIAGTNTPEQVLFQGYPVPLRGGTAAQNIINDLLFAGIDKLKSNLEDMVKNIGTASGNNLTILLSGVSVPGGQRMVLGITLNIAATVDYSVCETVPWKDVGDDCPGDTPSGL